ncbi:nucleotidyltransferase domain-containing protein [Oceanospirillum beijerinckii]|uniref:nucleotidyltransferase domain-containing protein n=1 Tax=Oceanospirillum beijerinckii TaxID=64976 RepID=UPI00048245DC|nr:nucleotidyltransferase domain-containing protein [Oceanospirillum beijerinckii]
MELENIAGIIFTAKATLDRKGVNADFYIFGSILTKGALYSDVDILVIYHKDDDVQIIRYILNDLFYKIPVDLCFMTRQEERELKFIMRTNAINIDRAVAT